jgi:hypothetical protein
MAVELLPEWYGNCPSRSSQTIKPRSPGQQKMPRNRPLRGIRRRYLAYSNSFDFSGIWSTSSLAMTLARSRRPASFSPALGITLMGLPEES